VTPEVPVRGIVLSCTFFCALKFWGLGLRSRRRFELELMLVTTTETGWWEKQSNSFSGMFFDGHEFSYSTVMYLMVAGYAPQCSCSVDMQTVIRVLLLTLH
jgi:hypothetical protein